jgi:16S rRNA (guanine966-N2)-methyltransferase
MKIIAGTAKGHPLKTPKSDKIIRPALGKVREAIFSSLGDITDLVFADVFAGTGSLGFEAISRGAQYCHFFDFHPEALKILNVNIKSLGFEKNCQVIRKKLPFGLKNTKWQEPVDVLFCDPPYHKELIPPTLAALQKAGVLDQNTLILCEHDKIEDITTPGFEIIKQKKFGQTRISYMRLI